MSIIYVSLSQYRLVMHFTSICGIFFTSMCTIYARLVTLCFFEINSIQKSMFLFYHIIFKCFRFSLMVLVSVQI